MPSFVKLVVKGSGGFGAGASWFQHWLVSNTGDVDDPPDLVSSLAGRIDTHLLPVLSDAWSCGRIDWTFWETEDSVPVPTQVENISTLVGEATGTNPMAPRQTMLIEYKTMDGLLPRKRIFVGRYNEGQNDSPGVPTGSVVSAIQSYADNTIGELSVNGHPWFFNVVRLVRAVTAGGQVYYHPQAWAGLTSHLVQTKWAFLSSRDVGHGI